MVEQGNLRCIFITILFELSDLELMQIRTFWQPAVYLEVYFAKV